MNTFKQLLFIVLSLSLLLSISGCEREWSNPFDDKSTIDPEAWAPQNLRIEKISINKLRLNWECHWENIEGFKIDRKAGTDAWVIAVSILPKNARSWDDTDLPVDMNFSYRVYAYAGNDKSSASSITGNTNILIGDLYKGGIVFYRGGTSGGLICTENDQSSGMGAMWGCYGTSISGTTTGIGTGKANTAVIVAACSDEGIAARLCDDLALNSYSDWFLPSKDELNLMYQNLKLAGLGGFVDGHYWSSSKSSDSGAWRQDFSTGDQNNDDNFIYYGRVRAVRAF